MTGTPTKQAMEAARKALSAYEALIDPVYSVVIEEVAAALDAFGKWYAHDLDQARKDAWAAQMAKLYARNEKLGDALKELADQSQRPFVNRDSWSAGIARTALADAQMLG